MKGWTHGTGFNSGITGIELTFSPDPSLSGWTDITHMYGTQNGAAITKGTSYEV